MIQSVPFIVFIVYALIELYKVVFSKFSKASNLIPLIAAILGGVIAIIAYHFLPNLMSAANWFEALVIGCMSGLSSTGINQVGKQIVKLKNTDDENTEK